MAGARIRAGMAALLACAAFAGVVARASGQQDERASDRVQPPTELLKEYPFEQGRLRGSERPATRSSGARSAALPTAGDPEGGWPVVWLALAAAALLGALALIARRAQRPSTARLFGPEIDARTEGTGWLVFGTEPKRPSPAPAAMTARFPRRGSPAPRRTST